MALARVRRTRIDQLVEEGHRSAKLVQAALEDPNRFISACQLGVTFATLGLGAAGESAFAANLGNLVLKVGNSFGWTLPAVSTARALCYILAFSIVAFVQTVIGELIPKRLTFQRAESVILVIIYPMEAWCRLTAPFIKLLIGATSLLLQIFRVKEPHSKSFVHSEEELKMLVSASHEEGVLEPEEEEMLHSVFDFSDTVTGEIMTPRTDMITVRADSTVREFIDLSLKYGFSRIPVYEENIDNIFGLIHIRDCVKAMIDHKENMHVRELARKVLVVPENKILGDLLPEFQRSKTHMAIVVDEYGATRGMVTLEDVVEELVGEIADEYDVVQEMIELQSDGSLIVDGKLTLDEANEKLGLEIHDDEFNTLGGHVFGVLGREPRPGDQVIENGYTLRIEELDRHRIIKLRLIKHVTKVKENELASSFSDSGDGNGHTSEKQDDKSVESGRKKEIINGGREPKTKTAG